MRRIPRGLAVAVGASLLLAACSGGGDAEPTPEAEDTPAAEETAPEEEADPDAPLVRGDADLVIWTDNLKIGPITEIAEAFGEANGISVEVQAGTDVRANFSTADAAGNGPDVVVGAHDWVGEFVQNGSVDPLTLTAADLGAYSESAVRAASFGGQLYGLPYGVESIALYRNTDIAPDAPATLDDAIAAGQAALDAGTVESALNLPVGENGDAYHMQPVLTSLGGYLFGINADGSYNPEDLGIGGPGSLAAAQKIYDLGEAGSNVLRRSISGDNTISLFAEGKSAFLISGPWALSTLDEAGVNYAITPIPPFAGQQPAKPFMGAQLFFVAAHGQNKPFAQEFINYMNSEESMQIMFDGAKLPPAMTSVSEMIAADNPNISVFGDAAAGADPMPAIPAMAAVWDPLGKAYSAIVGGADPASTITSAGDTIRAAIAGG